MTKKEEAVNLAALLDKIDSTCKEKNKKNMDTMTDNTVEVEPHKVKRKVPCKKFAGMSIPKPIYDICMYLKEIMEEQGTYNRALDLSLYNIAVQYFAYNEMTLQLVDPEEQFKPKPVNLAQTGETLRKGLREIGFTYGGSRNIKLEGPEETPLTKLISSVIGDDSEEMITISK